MAQDEFEYRGRRVSVSVFVDGENFGWRFKISDEKPVMFKRSPAPDPYHALAEARSAARSVLDLREGGA